MESPARPRHGHEARPRHVQPVPCLAQGKRRLRRKPTGPRQRPDRQADRGDHAHRHPRPGHQRRRLPFDEHAEIGPRRIGEQAGQGQDVQHDILYLPWARNARSICTAFAPPLSILSYHHLLFLNKDDGGGTQVVDRSSWRNIAADTVMTMGYPALNLRQGDGMARFGRLGTTLALAATLAGCGGGDSGQVASTSNGNGTGTISGSTNGCSLRSRQNWVAAQLDEWYLFPETLPANRDPSGYSTVSDYIDYLTATARAQRKDRYFTYITSIKEEEAFNSTGADAGFGFRLTADASQTKLMIAEAFEGGAALAAGIDRGTEIQGIGASTSDIRSISDIVRADPNNGISNAFGPDTVGTSRTLRVADTSGNV